MLPFEELTSRIIAASFRVHNSIGAGYLEHVYRNALALEIAKEGLTARIEAPLRVHYGGIAVGTCFADLIVEEIVVVEIKAQEAILPGHKAQVRAYLRCSGHVTGLVVNFGPVRVDVKRVDETPRGRKTG